MKIKDVKIGSKFKFGKIEFVKLDNAYGGCLCLATNILFGNRFDEDGVQCDMCGETIEEGDEIYNVYE